MISNTSNASNGAYRRRMEEALAAIPVAELSYQQWINVGMALKAEGFGCDIWDTWSQADSRYRPGTCEKKWNSFNGSATPVSGATVIHLAREFGWDGEAQSGFQSGAVAQSDTQTVTRNGARSEAQSGFQSGAVAQSDAQTVTHNGAQSGFQSGAVAQSGAQTVTHNGARVIENAATPIPDEEIYAWGDPILGDDINAPTEAFAHYLELLFEPEDKVSYVVNAYRDADGKWKPMGRGVFTRTAKELTDSLKASPSDLGATVGDWNPQAGAWIRFNPVDGNGVKNENVTAYRYALVEADSLTLGQQMEKLMALNIPVRALVTSGNRSLHAIVRVDAPNAETYAKRVSFLYDYLAENGFPVDTQNRNPSRLSRMPGVTRGNRGQGLLAENLGPDTWDAWEKQVLAQRAATGHPAEGFGNAPTVVGSAEFVGYANGIAPRGATVACERMNPAPTVVGGADFVEYANGIAPRGATVACERMNPAPTVVGGAEFVDYATGIAPRGAEAMCATGGAATQRAGVVCEAQGTPTRSPKVATGACLSQGEAHPDSSYPENLRSFRDSLPDLPDELIGGILRQGHKMLIAGPSKAGKSFLLLELAVAIAEGRPWLGFPCKKGRVLYVNLEIDRASCIHRIYRIYNALGITPQHDDDIEIWNLRGHAAPLVDLVPGIVNFVRESGCTVVIIDPIYKVIMGDENNATDMGYFCNQFDRIADATGASVIYCHHHSKGAQGGKKAMDRASGSGVFARDPDAHLDITPLEMSQHVKDWLWDKKSTPWRMEGTLREFPSFEPVDFWFKHPIHELDTEGVLLSAPTEGSAEAGRARNRKTNTADERRMEMEKAYADCAACVSPVTVKAMANYLAISEQTVRNRLKELPDIFNCKESRIWKVGELPPTL